MAQVKLTRTIDAPVADVWAAWDDYGGIWRFNPGLTGSHLINGSEKTGLGAERQCDLIDGKNYIQERIVEYIPERLMAVDIFHGTVPLKRATATIDMKPHGAARTSLTFTLEFEPKMGLLGRMMLPLMRRQFRRGLSDLVDANKAYVETGATVAQAA